MSASQIPFLDLRPTDADALLAAITRVTARGWYVLGPELEAFETAFAAACAAKHTVGVGNGTDALALALRAAGVEPGDEVIVPAITAAFTGLAVLMAGATPVFADVSADCLTLDPAACAAAITPRTAAIVPVHLYGQAADMPRFEALASRHGLVVVEDCCQAHLGTCAGRPVGTIGAAGAFSFYPTKNLGALGDAGAVVTNDPSIADRVRRLRNGGQRTRYHHAEAGVNSRLDELQAAVLRARLPMLQGWTDRRRAVAALYRRLLAGTVLEPVRERDAGHVYHLFAVRSAARDALQAHLAAAGIETLIHYPVPLNRQEAFAALAPSSCPVAERAAAELLSLPLHPGLRDADVHAIAETVSRFGKGQPSA